MHHKPVMKHVRDFNPFNNNTDLINGKKLCKYQHQSQWPVSNIPKILQQKFNFPLVVEVKYYQQEDNTAVSIIILLYFFCMEFIEWAHNEAIMSASIYIHTLYQIHLGELKLNVGLRIWTETYTNYTFVLIHSIQSLLYVKLKF